MSETGEKEKGCMKKGLDVPRFPFLTEHNEEAEKLYTPDSLVVWDVNVWKEHVKQERKRLLFVLLSQNNNLRE